MLYRQRSEYMLQDSPYFSMVTSRASMCDSQKEFEVGQNGKIIRKMNDKEVTKVREKFILNLIKMYDPACEKKHNLEC